jgi:hypothetical protein
MNFRTTFYLIVGALGILGGCFYSPGFALGLFAGVVLGAVFGFAVFRRWA